MQANRKQRDPKTTYSVFFGSEHTTSADTRRIATFTDVDCIGIGPEKYADRLRAGPHEWVDDIVGLDIAEAYATANALIARYF